MKLREDILIRASPGEIWPLLADPASWPSWNPKIIQITRPRSGLVVPGEQFQAVFQLKRSRNPTEVEILVVEPNRELRLRQHFDYQRKVRHVEVWFTVEPADSNARTRVTQWIDHSKSGMPLPVRGLIWLIHRFGRPTKPQPLHRLRYIIETKSIPPQRFS